VSWANPDPVATGPFTEVSSFETQSYQVERNPHYWQLPEWPKVKAIRFLAFPGNEQAAFALVSGEVDWAGSFVPAIDRIFAAQDREHHHYWFPPIDGGVLLYANTTRAPYDDVRVRKAISMAIDRSLVVEVGMYGYTRPADASGLSDAYRRYKDRPILASDWIRHDPARASALLDEAGFARGEDGIRRLPDGSRWEVAIQVPSGWSDWVRVAQVITRGLRAAGIDAHMKAHDFNAWYEQVQSGDFTMAIGWAEPYPTPYGYYRAMMSTATVKPVGTLATENWHRFGSRDADEVLRALEQTADPVEEHRLVGELQRLFVDRVPAIPLFPGPLWGAYNSTRFTGFPDAANPYAPLSPNLSPQALLVLTRLVPR
jgi:peptide/nickel transport system substrate-binding protein